MIVWLIIVISLKVFLTSLFKCPYGFSQVLLKDQCSAYIPFTFEPIWNPRN